METSGPTRTFQAALTGTQYVSGNGASGLLVPRMGMVAWTVSHPASTTTVYTVEVSNMSDEEIRNGQSDWTDFSDIVIPQQASEGVFYVEFIDFSFARVRLKAVTSSGSGTATVRQCTKGPH